MPYMTTRTLIHTHAHLQHRTMTGHDAETVTARPRSAAQFVINISVLHSEDKNSFSFFLFFRTTDGAV